MKRIVFYISTVSTLAMGLLSTSTHAQPHEKDHSTEHQQPLEAKHPPNGLEQHSTTKAPAHSADSAQEHETVHHPEPFNFIDLSRYETEKKKEEAKQKDTHGNPIVPVVPYGYMLLNSLLFFGILYYFGKKPIAQALVNRRQAIAKELEEAAAIKAEAQVKLDEYNQRLGALDQEIEQIRRDIIASGELERERIVRDAEEKSARMRRDTQFLLEQELKTLRHELRAYTAEVACAAAEAVLKSKITPSDQERIANEYVNQLATSNSVRPSSSQQGNL